MTTTPSPPEDASDGVHAPGPVVDQPAEDYFDTLTGFDELAIKRSFGVLPSALAATEPTMWIRSLVFVHLRRTEGLKDADAYNRVMQEMTLGEAADYFAESDGPNENPIVNAIENVDADTEGKGSAA